MSCKEDLTNTLWSPQQLAACKLNARAQSTECYGKWEIFEYNYYCTTLYYNSSMHTICTSNEVIVNLFSDLFRILAKPNCAGGRKCMGWCGVTKVKRTDRGRSLITDEERAEMRIGNCSL